MAYIGNQSTTTRKNTAVGVKSVVYASATHTGQIFTAANCGLPPYNAGNVQVAVNGVLLPSTTFTAIDGVSITLSGLTLSESDEINFLMFNEGAPEQVSTASAYISSGTIDNTIQTNTRLVDPTITTDTVINGTTESTDKDTGALVVEGGVGIEKNVNIGGNLDVVGNITGNYPVTLVKTTTDTIAESETIVLCGHATIPFTLTLYTAVGHVGRVLYIKNVNVATVTIEGNGTETIDGYLNYSLTTQYQSLSIISDGSNWHII